MSHKTYNELKNYMLTTIISSVNKRKKKTVIKKKRKKIVKEKIDIRTEEELKRCREEVLNGYKTIRK